MKKLIGVVLLLLAIGVGTAIYLWNKPHEKVEDRKGIETDAVELVAAFNDDESTANELYLNKAIEVSGTVGEIDTNQEGGIMIILDTGDPFAGVQCAMRESGVNVTPKQSVTVKGFCSGFGITGVSLTDCILK